MMLNHHQEKTISMIIFILCTTATVSQEHGKVPAKISTVTIPGTFTIDECPSDDNRQASLDLLRNSIRDNIYQILESPLPECGPGYWRKVFYLNASRADQQLCPGQWNLVTTPVKGCAGAESSCHSAFSEDINIAYSKVCGRIIGEGENSPDAFFRFIIKPKHY